MQSNTIKSYKDLVVWQKSYDLVKRVYEITRKLPKEEVFGLSSQMQRSAVSIPSNIAEGFFRKSQKEFAQFLHISFGSVAELETQLMLCQDIFNVSVKNEIELLTEVSKMLRGLLSSLKTNN